MAIQRKENNVGDVRQSILTEAQFQTLNGPGWVLMDGRDITGSGLATIASITTLPDARGVTIRGKNNGRADGKQLPSATVSSLTYSAASATVSGFTTSTINEVVVGQAVTGTNIPANTTVASIGTTTVVLSQNPTGAGTSLTFSGELPLGAFQSDHFKAHDHGIDHYSVTGTGGNAVSSYATATYQGRVRTVDNPTGSETRMKSITLNTFIKIN